jgi:transcription initiation factor TFIID subunit 8
VRSLFLAFYAVTDASFLVQVVQQLFQRAHEYANLANRASAIASDILLACEDFDIPPKELYQVKKMSTKSKRSVSGFVL